jgi:N-acetylglucosaminyldiphosphoundecaprenol N-acetyl-beta-D-mannosaminyltransferase
MVGGVPVHPVPLHAAVAWMVRRIEERQPTVVLYANVHGINLAQMDARLAATYRQADLVFCDGQGVRLGARLLGCHLPERYTPPDWIDILAQQCAERHYRMFLLGTETTIVEHAAQRLRARFPGLEVATHHGFFNPHDAENMAVRERINAFAPHVLLVGMSMPRQEHWIQENAPFLQADITLAVGALFDYLAERVPRGPRWLTDHGFEWVCRLWFEPRRLWRRYLLGNPRFLWMIIRERLRRLRV